MIGLFGQAAAYASIPQVVPAPVTMSGMSADCMQMMAPQPQPAKKPCNGNMLDCIAAMGCTAPWTMAEPFFLTAVSRLALLPQPIGTTRPLVTRVVPPELQPPSLIQAHSAS